VAAAIDSAADVKSGMEWAEGISKLLAAIFICSLAMKIPKWFGISNYVSPRKLNLESLDETEDMPVRRYQLGASLFWNSLREVTEAGT
jgi:hypothetical protein